MKIGEFKNLQKEELLNKLKSLQEELFKLNFQRKSGQVDKPHRFQEIRKDIARIKTVLNEMKQKVTEA